MTMLTKPVARRTIIMLDNRLNVRNRDQITVTLHPDNTIGFRAYKRRREVRLPLLVAYKLAIKEEARQVLLVKEAKRAKAAGRRPRKPRRSLLFP